MSDAIQLKIREQKGTSKVKSLRESGQIPGVIYGDNIPSRNFSIADSALMKIMREKTGTGLFDIKMEGEDSPVKAILHDLQKDPVTGRNVHVDFYQVRMDKKLHTDLNLEFVGESSAIKDLGGILVKQKTELPIECLPSDLISSVDVDISSLKSFEEVIRVKDIALPKGIMVMHLDPEEIVVSVSAPRSEAELEDLEKSAEADVSAVEVQGAKKEEGAEAGKEGDAADGEKPEEKK